MAGVPLSPLQNADCDYDGRLNYTGRDFHFADDDGGAEMKR